jgi:alcohol dehydrogenase (NADP+)
VPTVKAYAAQDASSHVAPFEIDRRGPGSTDVVIDILYCGVCHTDIHFARNEWGFTQYPVVPGHEIVGKVLQAGAGVKKFKAGDSVGVGCMVGSCGECGSCKDGEEQFCVKGPRFTYNGMEADGKTPTYGGYSTQVVADEKFVLRIPANLPLDRAAPLLCAGITTYSPLRHWKVKAGDRVAVVGLGGLGHMGVKLAAAMGAEVTVLSTSDSKKADALKLGAKHFLNSRNPETFRQNAGKFSFILGTVSAKFDVTAFLSLLGKDGVMVQVGAPAEPVPVGVSALLFGRKSLAGSLIGGTKETQEMLDFCGSKGITADVEVIPMQKINEAYERMLKGDVKYRFVIDLASLK